MTDIFGRGGRRWLPTSRSRGTTAVVDLRLRDRLDVVVEFVEREPVGQALVRAAVHRPMAIRGSAGSRRRRWWAWSAVSRACPVLRAGPLSGIGFARARVR